MQNTASRSLSCLALLRASSLAAGLCAYALLSAPTAYALFEQREIAAVSRSQSTDLFAIDSDFSIKHYFRAPRADQFSGVVQLDGLGRDIAAVERGDGNFEVFIVGMGGDAFPSFTTSRFDTPFGKNTTTVSLASAGTGTFDPNTGRVQLQVTLHLDQSLDVPLIQEDTDVTLTLTTDGARPLTQGQWFAETGLSGAGPLVVRKGVSPLQGMLCKVSVAGYFVAPAALLLSPAH